QHAAVRGQAQRTVERLVQQRLAVGHAHERLRIGAARNGPQARAGAAGQDDWKQLHVITRYAAAISRMLKRRSRPFSTSASPADVRTRLPRINHYMIDSRAIHPWIAITGCFQHPVSSAMTVSSAASQDGKCSPNAARRCVVSSTE